jgi:hypothetical protein
VVEARTGRAWKKIKRWFGYGLHLIADTQYAETKARRWDKVSRPTARPSRRTMLDS